MGICDVLPVLVGNAVPVRMKGGIYVLGLIPPAVMWLPMRVTVPCQMEVCKHLAPDVLANSVICILAGTLCLATDVHQSFADAGYVADQKTIKKITHQEKEKSRA